MHRLGHAEEHRDALAATESRKRLRWNIEATRQILPVHDNRTGQDQTNRSRPPQGIHARSGQGLDGTSSMDGQRSQKVVVARSVFPSRSDVDGTSHDVVTPPQ